MLEYKNVGGKSSVTGYEPISGGIRVEFGHRSVYEYTAAHLGEDRIRMMLELAASGNGLCSYINKNPEIRKGWSRQVC